MPASRDSWRAKLASAGDAVSVVRSGTSVFVGTACATPRTLVEALGQRPRLDIQLVHFMTDGAVLAQEYSGGHRMQHQVFFVGANMRDAVRRGEADYIPISLAQADGLIASGRLPIDVALIQVSPPDSHGQCSLGVSVDLTLSAALKADIVIAEVNPNMPRTAGASSIPVDRIHHLVEVDTPVIEYVHAPSDADASQIARFVARIISDGATLQIGLGRMPNEMLRYLTNRRDLGVHSDVVTEPLVDLIDTGVITGQRKSLHPGQIVASYCMGTRRLYDLVDDNPMFNFQAIDYVCDPRVIAQNHQMVSVTQAFTIDITGQVCAEQFDGRPYGGISSQPEFMRGAAAAPGGKSIICLASTSEDGAESRIRPSLTEGESVTIARSDVHFVVTEYGIAYLFGKSIAERAVALIEIANPRFRDELLASAKRLGYVAAQIELRDHGAYPAQEERNLRLRNGAEVLLRPTRATDVDGMRELFYQMTPRDIYTRFFTNLQSLSVPAAQHLCSVSYEREMAFAAVVGGRESERLIGSSCYYLDPSTDLADCAYMIHPEWQGVGLGTALQSRMIEYARDHSVRGFTADVLGDNDAMLAVMRKSGCRVTSKVVSGAYEVTMLF